MRKIFTAVLVAGALAAGTASATSLGDFTDVTFAATDIELAACTATDVDVLPSVPSVGVTNDTFGVESVRLVGLVGNCANKLVDVSFITYTAQNREVMTVQTALPTPATIAQTAASVGVPVTLPFSSPLALDIEDIIDVEIVLYDAVPAP